MALIVLQSGAPALGQFDANDSELTSFAGGEVCTLTSTNFRGTDQAAADSYNDGYTGNPPSQTRPVVTKTLAGTEKPLFLSDDGTAGYGTLFGRVVGGTVGQIITTGAQLGPHTATGSGKITLHNQMGLYGVTLDAIDRTTNGILEGGMAVGDALYFTASGQLTTLANRVGSAPVVGRFVEFVGNGSYVSTPASLSAALNSPSGSIATNSVVLNHHIVFSWSGTVN